MAIVHEWHPEPMSAYEHFIWDPWVVQLENTQSLMTKKQELRRKQEIEWRKYKHRGQRLRERIQRLDTQRVMNFRKILKLQRQNRILTATLQILENRKPNFG